MNTLTRKAYNRVRRLYRRQLDAVYHRLRFGHLNLPIVFGNSFPKSGTNLLLQILRGVEALGPFLNRETFISTYDDRRRTGFERSSQEIVREIHGLLPGEIAGGHLHATPENMSALIHPNVVNYFIYRDPRDVVVSHAFYVTNIAPRHRLHHHYTEVLDGMEERIAVSITGTPNTDLELRDIRSRLEPYLGWFEVDQVMLIRFEDLIRDREQVIGRILDHFVEISGYQLSLTRREAIETLTQYIDPARSPTFRQGEIGGWRKHFTDEHTVLFKELAGDLLVQLGYERDTDW